MGGDHKCPVCEATFTRPQHVARHMRSHTGDRPYQCQHCGDQFARSDLLSRHVNKCHGNEKPSGSPTRRKGSAFASRATTSKQACDQCVQSSLPCDGSNPCVKCVQQKCRCTFVKFHRQTAPVGPGHHPRPPSFSSRLKDYSHSEEFVSAPSPLSVPSMSESGNTYSHDFTLPQIYPSDNPASLTMSSPQLTYQTQPEFSNRPVPYPDPQSGPPWMDWSQGPSSFDRSNMDNNTVMPNRYYHADVKPMGIDRDLQVPMSRHFMEGESERLSHTGFNNQSSTYTLQHCYPGGVGYHSRARRGSVDQFSSDESSASLSIPSSAASSNVQLPLGDIAGVSQQHMGYHKQHAPGSYLPSHLSQMSLYPSARQDNQRDGAVSSAFGSMSLDDLASIAADGAPFFSSAAMSMIPGDPDSTPMAQKHPDSRMNRIAPSNTPGSVREAETKELKDFWKAYVRTPLTGGEPLGTDLVNVSNGDQRPPTSPNSLKRIVRVNSLPSVKTPPVEQFNHHHQGMAEPGNGMSSMCHAPGKSEDLRSYEAAVLARKPPTTLNLVPRKRTSQTTSPIVPPSHPNPMVVGSTMEFSRPSTASSSNSSSLANAFGDSSSSSSPQQPSRPSHAATSMGSMCFASEQAKIRMHAMSRESSGEDHDHDDHLRPSFKRLPSQTLGPVNSKRVLLSDSNGEEREKDGTPNGRRSGVNGTACYKY